MAFVVVYDACVLYPAALRDLLIRLGVSGLVRARWTETILDECFRSIARQRPELASDALARTRSLMNRAVPDCLVSGFEPLIPSLTLPDADDRHVLAAAVRVGAQVIVTFNLDDFPAAALSTFEVEAQHPDEFVLGLLDLAPASISRVVIEQAASLRNPARTVGDLLDVLLQQGLVRTVAKLRELFGSEAG